MLKQDDGANSWLRESWEEYKEAVASRSPGIVKRVVQNKHFDKFIIYEIVAIIAISVLSFTAFEGGLFDWIYRGFCHLISALD